MEGHKRVSRLFSGNLLAIFVFSCKVFAWPFLLFSSKIIFDFSVDFFSRTSFLSDFSYFHSEMKFVVQAKPIVRGTMKGPDSRVVNAAPEVKESDA